VEAYAALWEGPFANSILESRFFCWESEAVMKMEPVDQTALEILQKLKGRMLENRKKFPWKVLNSSIEKKFMMEII
jgi:hypothetical protein